MNLKGFILEKKNLFTNNNITKAQNVAIQLGLDKLSKQEHSAFFVDYVLLLESVFYDVYEKTTFDFSDMLYMANDIKNAVDEEKVTRETRYALMTPMKDNVDDPCSLAILTVEEVVEYYAQEYPKSVAQNIDEMLDTLCYSDDYFLDGSWIRVDD